MCRTINPATLPAGLVPIAGDVSFRGFELHALAGHLNTQQHAAYSPDDKRQSNGFDDIAQHGTPPFRQPDSQVTAAGFVPLFVRLSVLNRVLHGSR